MVDNGQVVPLLKGHSMKMYGTSVLWLSTYPNDYTKVYEVIVRNSENKSPTSIPYDTDRTENAASNKSGSVMHGYESSATLTTYKLQTRPLVRQGAPQRQSINF
jgi:subtilase family serine protease